LLASGAAHVVLALLLVVAPAPAPLPLPAVVSVSLIAAPPAPRRPAPRAKAAKPPPPVAPAAVPPPPVSKKKVLPRKAAPAEAKSQPKPKRRPKKELAYDDALAALRSELGESDPPPTEEVLDDPTDSAALSGPGRVDPTLARWQVAVNAALGRTWVAPAEYRNSSLRTSLLVTVLADGTVVGAPVVKRSSGNPYFDDNAVRAVLQASPLPPPPRPGNWPILFDPTE
jgi:TonB family protein